MTIILTNSHFTSQYLAQAEAMACTTPALSEAEGLSAFAGSGDFDRANQKQRRR